MNESMTAYNTIGKNYTITRQPDERITQALIQYLNIKPPALLADIGAGTGNYTRALANHGYRFIAVEPSNTMQAQSQIHRNILWRYGYAENIPINDNEVEGVIATLALHHFTNLEKSIGEMVRICPDGPIVIFTCDPRIAKSFWLLDYFPSFYEQACQVFPATDDLRYLLNRISKRSVTIHPFPLPADLRDGFLASIWKTPEKALDPAYCAGVSSFALEQPHVIQIGLDKLKSDLDSGIWHQKYQSIFDCLSYDAGYRFFVIEKN